MALGSPWREYAPEARYLGYLRRESSLKKPALNCVHESCIRMVAEGQRMSMIFSGMGPGLLCKACITSGVRFLYLLLMLYFRSLI